MMLSSTGRAAGADLRDVNFVDLIKLTSAMTSEHTTKTGHESGAHDNRNTAGAGLVIEFKQAADLRGLIGRRDNGDALLHRPTSQTELRPGRCGGDNDVWAVADPAATARNRTVAEIVDKALKSFEVGIADLKRVDGADGAQLPSDPSTGRAGAKE